MITWVIGAGGLFGQALVRASENVFIAPRIPWRDLTGAIGVFSQALTDFTELAGGEDWRIVWAAGQATTTSTPKQANRENELFDAFVEILRRTTPPGRGVFALTSSAGGIYAGSLFPPFTSETPPAPLGSYGELKLAQETSARSLSSRIPVVVARVSNLYGCGQDLSKLQGIISHLALAAVTKQPANIFVPLDTLRDYIYADDAAARALHWATQALQTQESATRVIGSGRPETLSHILTLMNKVTRTRIPVASGFHASSAYQAPDLRLRPDSDSFVQALPATQLPEGMRRVYLDITVRFAHANLATTVDPMTNQGAG